MGSARAMRLAQISRAGRPHRALLLAASLAFVCSRLEAQTAAPTPAPDSAPQNPGSAPATDAPQPAAPATDAPQPAAPAPEAAAPADQQIVHGDDQARNDFLDRMQKRLFNTVWRSAMGLDHMFGSTADAETYQETSGSLAPALLWDRVEGVSAQMRFRANIPLPQLNDRFSAFVGRVNPNEYVTERDEESGALRRQYGPIEEDQTLLGISYREPPKQGSRFDAGAGVRVRFPPDPYVKGSYIYVLGDLDRTMFTFRQTVFWQSSEQIGTTTRVDVERLLNEHWLLHWTGSGTLSEETEGIRGYSAFDVLRPLSQRAAMAFEVGFDGETRNDVPLHDYGFKLAYRHQTLRDWLVVEYRTSLTWPKDDPTQNRRASFGLGIGFEILFGSQAFLARPTTF